MRKTTLAVMVSAVLGGLAFVATPASAMPAMGAAVHADQGAVTHVRMTSSERMMMRKRMMRKKMMRKEMMHRKMMHRRGMMHRM